jgi:hypothetical protein
MSTPPRTASEREPFAFARARPDALRVAVIPERYGQVFSPCASIRLQPFCHAMARGGELNVRYLLPGELDRFGPDVVIWHRVSIADAGQRDVLARLRDARGTRLVYDLDDNLLDLEGHGQRAVYDAMRDDVGESLALADEVWTSTPRLAARAALATAAVVKVLPTALDPELWGLDLAEPTLPATSRRQAPLQLLYMGTRTHDADFKVLERALEALHAKRPGSFRLSIVGVRADAGRSPPWLRTVEGPPYMGASYPAFVAWFRGLAGFDLGVAPLLSSPFNDCKSPVKVLDYAAIGLPTLASAVPAYMDSLQGGRDCLHARNEPGAWIDAIEQVLADRGILAQVASTARRLVAPAHFAEGVRLREERIRHATTEPCASTTEARR